MRRVLKLMTTIVAAFVVLVGSSFVSTQSANAAVYVNESAKVQDMLKRLNNYRASKGVPAVKLSSALTPISRDWAIYMADNKTMIHNPNYSNDPRIPAGESGSGEIVAMNNIGTSSQFIDQWINSPGHEANMTEDFWNYASIGIARNNDTNLWYAVINFWKYDTVNPDAGYTPPPSTPAPTPTPPAPTPKPTPTKPAPKPTPTKPSTPKKVDVYTMPGYHVINGREWRTTCEAYSPTVTRCRAEIKATQIKRIGGKFVQRTDWVFNNLTYLPSPRAQWKGNPLATNTTWKAADGRQWKTSCGDSWTGPNGCRSFTMTTYYESYIDSKGNRQFRQTNGWVFNNIVQFKG